MPSSLDMKPAQQYCCAQVQLDEALAFTHVGKASRETLRGSCELKPGYASDKTGKKFFSFVQENCKDCITVTVYVDYRNVTVPVNQEGGELGMQCSWCGCPLLRQP